jgi:CheY-like chemotaxis protein
MKIVILEDNAPRRAAMEELLRDRFSRYELRFFESPQASLDYLREHLDEVLLISLDHDMELISDGNGGLVDLGTGQQLADYLATQPPVCPVVIHSSNGNAALAMRQVLENAGWKTSVVAPYEDLQWIGEAWFPLVRRAIVDSAQPIKPSSAARAG